MKKILYLIMPLILLSGRELQAQLINIFDINSDNYPEINAKVYVVDQYDKMIRNIDRSDLKLTEIGSEINIKLVECPPEKTPKAISVVLTLDVSGSMTGAKLEAAKDAAIAWIKTMDMSNSECAVTVFNGNSRLVHDFSNNRLDLINAVKEVSAFDGTNYNSAFLYPSTGALRIAEKGKYNKVILFLTDGQGSCNAEEVINYANKISAKIYCITVDFSMPAVLKNISEQTGGKAFNYISTDGLKKVFIKILNIAQNLNPCTITWTTSGCELNKPGEITYLPGGTSEKFIYSGNSWNYRKLSVSPYKIINFGQVYPTVSAAKQIKITSENGDIYIEKITNANPQFYVSDWDGSQPPFLLKEGESRTLTITYQPADNNFTYTRLIVEADICFPPVIYARGGSAYNRPPGSLLNVTFPNGGEKFYTGSDSVITWTGLTPDEPVKIELSTDSGQNWSVVDSAAGDFKFDWKNIPDTPSNECLIKLTGRGENYDKTFLTKMIPDSVNSRLLIRDMVVDTGGKIWFGGLQGVGKVQVGFKEQHKMGWSPSAVNPVLGCVSQTGELLKSIDIVCPDGIGAVDNICTDFSGHIYISGYFSHHLELIDDSSSFYYNNTVDTAAFLAKYDNGGRLIWAKVFNNIRNCTSGSDLKCDNEGNIYFTSGYHLQVRFNKDIVLEAKAAYYNYFLAKFDPSGDCLWAVSGESKSYSTGSELTIDPNDNVIVTGSSNGGYLKLDSGQEFNEIGLGTPFILKYDKSGNYLWGHLFGTTFQFSEASAIKADYKGNIYLYGYFSDDLKLDEYDTLKGTGGHDLFLIKYLPDGTIQWAKAIIGKFYNSPWALTLDDNGFPVITGDYMFEIDFGNGHKLGNDIQYHHFIAWFDDYGNCLYVLNLLSTIYIRSYLNYDNFGNLYYGGQVSEYAVLPDGTEIDPEDHDVGFIWKIPNGITFKSQDQSDTVFSIVRPELQAADIIDMGKVIVNDYRDSVVTGFIHNPNDITAEIDSIWFTGPDAGQFGIVSGMAPLSIGAGESHDVEFRFNPISTGIRNADINIRFFGDTLVKKITGVGVKPELLSNKKMINFGCVNSGTDTSIKYYPVINVSNIQVKVTIKSLGPDKDHFSIDKEKQTIDIAPGDSLALTAYFSPVRKGRSNGSVGIFYDGPGSPIVTDLFGEADCDTNDNSGITLKLRELKAPTGSVVNIPVDIIYEDGFVPYGIGGINADLQFNSTILVPYGKTAKGTVTEGIRTVPIYLPFDTLQGGTPWKFTFQVTLGNAESTDLELKNAVPDNGYVKIKTEPGKFTVSNICKEGGSRLMIDNGTTALLGVQPNPANDNSTINYQLGEAGMASLTLYDLYGREVVSIANTFMKPGRYESGLNTGHIPSGSYILVFRTETVSKQMIVRVIK